MSILNYQSIRSKWHQMMFKNQGIKRVVEEFDVDSTEFHLFENFLSEFSNKYKFNNRYNLMVGVDLDTFFGFYNPAVNMLNTLCGDETHNFKLGFEKGVLFVNLLEKSE